MFNRFSQGAREAIVVAGALARAEERPRADSIDLATAALAIPDPSARRLLLAAGLDTDQWKTVRGAVPDDRVQLQGPAFPLSHEAKKTIQNALREAIREGSSNITPAHLLLGAISNRRSVFRFTELDPASHLEALREVSGRGVLRPRRRFGFRPKQGTNRGLLTIAEDSRQPPRVRIDALIALFDERLRGFDPNGAGEFAHMMEAIEGFEYEGWHRLGMLAELRGASREQIDEYQRMAASDNPMIAQHVANAGLGWAHLRLGRFDQARLYLTRGLAAAEQPLDRFHRQLGLVELDLEIGDIASAGERLANLERLEFDPPPLSLLWRRLLEGTLAEQQGRIGDAEQGFSAAQGGASLAGSWLGIRSALGLGRLDLHSSQPKAVIDRCRKIEDRAEVIDAQEWSAEANILAGHALASIGNIPAARTAWQRAVEVFTALQNPYRADLARRVLSESAK